MGRQAYKETFVFIRTFFQSIPETSDCDLLFFFFSCVQMRNRMPRNHQRKPQELEQFSGFLGEFFKGRFVSGRNKKIPW